MRVEAGFQIFKGAPPVFFEIKIFLPVNAKIGWLDKYLTFSWSAEFDTFL